MKGISKASTLAAGAAMAAHASNSTPSRPGAVPDAQPVAWDSGRVWSIVRNQVVDIVADAESPNTRPRHLTADQIDAMTNALRGHA